MRGFLVSLGVHAAGVFGLVVLPSFSASQAPPVHHPPPPLVAPPRPVRLQAIARPVLPPRRPVAGGGGGVVSPSTEARSTQPAAAISDEPLRPEDIALPSGTGVGEAQLPGPGSRSFAAAVAEPPRLVRAIADVRPPRKLAGADPVYPPLARTARVEGTVVLECTIDRDGRIGAIRMLSGHPLLNAAAVDAVTGWRYTPTLLNGVPVSVLMTVTVEFKLKR
jgi:protein TonB